MPYASRLHEINTLATVKRPKSCSKRRRIIEEYFGHQGVKAETSPNTSSFSDKDMSCTTRERGDPLPGYSKISNWELVWMLWDSLGSWVRKNQKSEFQRVFVLSPLSFCHFQNTMVAVSKSSDMAKPSVTFTCSRITWQVMFILYKSCRKLRSNKRNLSQPKKNQSLNKIWAMLPTQDLLPNIYAQEHAGQC